MSYNTSAFAQRGPDGLAVIGRTLHDLRGIRFEEGTGGAGTTDTGAAGTTTDTTAGSTAAGTATTEPAAWDGKIESLPAAAQKIITDLRKEAGDNRVKANTATDTQRSILLAVAKAAGIEIPGEKPDPEKLAADLKKSNDAAKQASIQLAVYKAAGAHQGNPDLLLDSNTFLAKVNTLDPTAADFGSQISEAIKAAVTANASLKTARAAGASTVDTSGGTGEQGQITEAQLAQMTPEEIVDAQKKGLLKNLLS